MLADKADQGYIEGKLSISQCYDIQNYTCSETNEFQKFIKNPIHMNIGPACPIEEIDETEKIPRFSFRFCSVDYLDVIKDKNEEFPDLIGILKELKDRNKQGGEPFIVLSLADINGRTMNISLWKDCISISEKFDRNQLINAPSQAVVAVTSVKASTYRGNLTINSTDATHVYINPPIPEKDALLDRPNTNLSVSTASPKTVITLTQLHSKTKANVTGKTFLCQAHITSYHFKQSWYNAICPPCGKYIPQQGDSWFCTTNGKVPSPRFMYNISATISDTKSTMSVLLTDETVKKIIGKPCATLVQNECINNRKVLPPILDKQRFENYNFHLELARKAPADQVLFAAVDISPAPIAAEELIATTPAPATPSTDLSDDSPIQASKSSSKEKSSTSRCLSYDSTDDISKLNPSKRQRFTDA